MKMASNEVMNELIKMNEWKLLQTNWNDYEWMHE